MKKVLVTGHKGFIGSNLITALSRRGITTWGAEKNDPFPSSSLIKEMDAVIHLGANSSTTETDLDKILDENYSFSKDLFSICKLMKVPFQYASSASVYGDDADNPDEYDFYRPKNPYGLSKYLFDLWIQKEGGAYQGFRYFNCYGRNEEHKGDQASPISKFRLQAHKGEIKIFKNSENYLRDFVCVEDVCRVHIRFLKKPDVTGVFNVGTGKPISFRQIAEWTAKRYSAKISEIDMPESLSSHYQSFTKANLTRLLSVFPDYDPITPELFINKYYDSIFPQKV